MITSVSFDMDGTLCDFYGVPEWLSCLMNEDTYPYEVAAPLIHMATLARRIHQLQALGVKVKIISWLSKNGSDDFNEAVTATKIDWLAKHLPSVKFDEIIIVPYGTPKEIFSDGILFDDEERNRENWNKAGENMNSFNVGNILEVLKMVTEM